MCQRHSYKPGQSEQQLAAEKRENIQLHPHQQQQQHQQVAAVVLLVVVMMMVLVVADSEAVLTTRSAGAAQTTAKISLLTVNKQIWVRHWQVVQSCIYMDGLSRVISCRF